MFSLNLQQVFFRVLHFSGDMCYILMSQTLYWYLSKNSKEMLNFQINASRIIWISDFLSKVSEHTFNIKIYVSGFFPNQTLALYRYRSEDKIEKILHCAIGPGQAKQGTHQAALSQGGVGRTESNNRFFHATTTSALMLLAQRRKQFRLKKKFVRLENMYVICTNYKDSSARQ